MLSQAATDDTKAMMLLLLVFFGIGATIVLLIAFEIRKRARRRAYIRHLESEIENIRRQIQLNENRVVTLRPPTDAAGVQQQQLMLQKMGIQQSSLASRMSQLQHELSDATRQAQSSTVFFVWWSD